MTLTTLIIFLAIALAFALFAIVYISITQKESPVVAAEALKQNFVNEAQRGEAAVVGAVHTLEGEIVARLHAAEAEKVLKAGTTQAFVDAHTSQVEAAALVAQTAATQVAKA